MQSPNLAAAYLFTVKQGKSAIKQSAREKRLFKGKGGSNEGYQKCLDAIACAFTIVGYDYYQAGNTLHWVLKEASSSTSTVAGTMLLS